METKLPIKDRLKLIELLGPVSSSYAKRKLLSRFMDELSLTEEEIKNTGYVELSVPGGISFKYNRDHDPLRAFNIGEVVKESIVSALKAKDTQGNITADLVDLFEMFCKPE